MHCVHGLYFIFRDPLLSFSTFCSLCHIYWSFFFVHNLETSSWFILVYFPLIIDQHSLWHFLFFIYWFNLFEISFFSSFDSLIILYAVVSPLYWVFASYSSMVYSDPRYLCPWMSAYSLDRTMLHVNRTVRTSSNERHILNNCLL